MLTKLPEGEGWDLSYIGVVPEFRRHGLGRLLTLHALHVAQKTDAMPVVVAVDQRNLPAKKLYESLGFHATESREVYLYIMSNMDK